MSDLFIMFFSIGFGVIFIMASPRNRAGLVLLSLCFNVLGRLDVGITLDLTKICALLGWGLLFSGSIRPSDFSRTRLIRCFFPFWCFVVMVCVIGYYFVPPNEAASGWARGSQGRPIVQLISVFSMVSLIPIVAAGLKREEDVRWFIRCWIGVGLLASAIGLVQVGWHQVTGSILWGIRRSEEIRNQDALVRIAGWSIQQANGFSGEPKQMGMLLVLSFVVLISIYTYRIQFWKEKRMFLYSSVMLLGIFLTFSSGAWLALVLFVFCLCLSSTGKVWRIRIALATCIFAGLLTGRSFWQGVYESRISKIPQFFSVVINPELSQYSNVWGGDKEVPSLVYLILHPHLAITGVGMGCAPFYYEPLVVFQHKGIYQDPNSGLTWAIYSFGFIGVALFAVGLYFLAAGIGSTSPFRRPINLMLFGIAVYFLPLNPQPYLLIVIGLIVSRGVKAITETGQFHDLPEGQDDDEAAYTDHCE